VHEDLKAKEGARRPMLSHVSRSELREGPVSAIAVCGKELQVESTVGAALRLLARRTVKVVPVLSGRRYVGVVDRDTLAEARDDVRVGVLARDIVPTATAATLAHEALHTLDARGGTRLVVLDEDEATYVGLVCLRGDRSSLCVDVEYLAPKRGGSSR